MATLGYQAPQLVGGALSTSLGGAAARWRIADAGCGTGLCAPYLRPYARELTGIDLSPRMLEQAAAKALYDELHEGELVEFFSMRPAAFDVIVSADTLCYFGALDDFAQSARYSLSDGGWLVCTVEALIDDDNQPAWRLQQHGRYCHTQQYVEDALAESHFDVRTVERVVLRQESTKPVEGWLVTAVAMERPLRRT